MAYTKEQMNKIVELKKQGKGVTEIGRLLNLDRGQISKKLKELGYSTERNPIQKDIFSIIDSEEKAYWLGFLYADGYVNKIQGQVAVALKEEDLQHLKKLKNFLKCNNKISYDKTNHAYKLSFCCSQITNDLIKLGAITIGEEIATPMNCYGNNNWIENDYFASSSAYLNPVLEWSALSKEEFYMEVQDKYINPIIFKPDILINEQIEDYLENKDVIYEYAIKYSKDIEINKK